MIQTSKQNVIRLRSADLVEFNKFLNSKKTCSQYLLRHYFFDEII